MIFLKLFRDSFLPRCYNFFYWRIHYLRHVHQHWKWFRGKKRHHILTIVEENSSFIIIYSSCFDEISGIVEIELLTLMFVSTWITLKLLTEWNTVFTITLLMFILYLYHRNINPRSNITAGTHTRIDFLLCRELNPKLNLVRTTNYNTRKSIYHTFYFRKNDNRWREEKT